MREFETDTVSQRDLHAYYDGELGRLARWRFERRLQRVCYFINDLHSSDFDSREGICEPSEQWSHTKSLLAPVSRLGSK